jgi:cytochrome c oxidase subunit 2
MRFARTCATSNRRAVIEACSSSYSSAVKARRGDLRVFTIICVIVIACGLAVGPGGAQSSDTASDASARTFIVSAKKYEFAPSEIRVQAGERVRLKVHSVDETHGIKLDLYPEGSTDKTIVGLKFDHPEDNGKVEKNVDQVLEFVAEKPGKYEFKCAKVCGMHHGKMKGELIVE